MNTYNFEPIIADIKTGKVVPYLGPGVLQGVDEWWQTDGSETDV